MVDVIFPTRDSSAPAERRLWDADVVRYAATPIAKMPTARYPQDIVFSKRKRVRLSPGKRSFWASKARLFWDDARTAFYNDLDIKPYLKEDTLNELLASEWRIDQPVSMTEVIAFEYHFHTTIGDPRLPLTVGDIAYLLSVDRQRVVQSIYTNPTYEHPMLAWWWGGKTFRSILERLAETRPVKRLNKRSAQPQDADPHYDTLLWAWAARYPVSAALSDDDATAMHHAITNDVIVEEDRNRIYNAVVEPSHAIGYDVVTQFWEYGVFHPLTISEAIKAGIDRDLMAQMERAKLPSMRLTNKPVALS
jgi:hypothetical protein